MSTVVTTFAELRDALENTDETYIYFGADIYGDDQGVKIPNTKADVVIDGTYDGIRYKYRDYGNETNGYGLPDYTIRINNPAGGTFRITMQNMLIDSINYYGPMTGANAATDANVTLVMRNVEYYGPQTAYNRYGCMEYHDSTFTITNQYYYSEEFAECNRVIFGGKIDISHHPTQIYHMFPLAAGSSDTRAITVLAGADVTIDTGNSLFGLAPAITIEENASLTITTTKSLSGTTAAYASPFIIKKNASFHCVQTARDGAISTIYCNDRFEVGEGATVYMEAQYDNANELIDFSGSGRTLALNNPKSFILRSRTAGVVSFGSSNRLEVTGGQINYWSSPVSADDPGGFNDIPAYSWRKTLLSDNTRPDTYINATTTNTAFTPDADGTNLTAEELDGKPLSGLLLYKAYAFSVGSLPLSVEPLTDDQYPVSGLSASGAAVRISYFTDDAHTYSGTADAGGVFSIPTDEAIPADTAVTIDCSRPFLLNSLIISAIPAGTLVVGAPSTDILFEIKKRLSGPPNVYGRKDDDWAITVTDTRVRSSPWQLQVTADSPLTSVSDPEHTLPGSLIFIDGNGVSHPLGTSPVSIWTGEASDGSPLVTTVHWEAGQGLLMTVSSTPFYMNESYRTPLAFELVVMENTTGE